MIISVVIPLYNKVSHVRRAVDSVLAQTCVDYELIIVNDGSTDGSDEVVRGVTDRRLRMIVQDNAGVAAARNRGVSEAHSELIAFLDADDEWAPDFLETVLILRQRYPAAAIWATGFNNSSDANIKPARFHQADKTHELLAYFSDDSTWNELTSSSVLISKDALQTVGGFPEGIVRGEDTDTWMRIALRYPIAWTSECKVTVFLDAENRTESFNYIGNWPMFQSLRKYQRECGVIATGQDQVYRFLARRHTPLLQVNWLGNERDALREIVRDCRRIRGFRLKCYLWYLLSWVPQPLVRLAWKLKSCAAGRGGNIDVSRFRNIRQSDRALYL